MRSVVGLVCLIGCGRIGFDARDDAGDDGAFVSLVASVNLPPGGSPTMIARTANDSVWYVASATGSWRSTDRATWTRCTDIDGSLRGIAVAPDLTVYVTTGSDVMKSRDSCTTWSSAGLGRGGQGIVVAGPRVVVGSDSDIALFDGNSWSSPSVDVFAGVPVGDVAVTRDGLFVVAAGRPLGLAVSEDGGMTWTSRAAGLANQQTLGIDLGQTSAHGMFVSQDNDTAFIVGAVSYSSDLGQTWETRQNLGGYFVAIDPSNSTHVVAGVFDDLVESFDAMTSTNPGQRSTGMALATAFDGTFASDRSVLVATGRGMFLSPPGPLVWKDINAGLDGWEIRSIATSGSRIALATVTSALVSDAGGAFRAPSATGMNLNSRFNGMTFVGPSILGSGRYIHLSDDGGQTWTPVFGVGLEDDFSMDGLASFGTRVYGGSRTRLLVSEAPYTTWTPRPFPSPHWIRDLLVLDLDTVFAATDDGLFSTTDAGLTWAPTSLAASGPHDFALTSDGRILVAADDGLWISDAAHASWARVGPSFGIDRVLVSGDRWFISVIGGPNRGVHESRNDGVTWRLLQDTVALRPRALAIDPNTGHLLIGTVGHGLWHRPLE